MKQRMSLHRKAPSSLNMGDLELWMGYHLVRNMLENNLNPILYERCEIDYGSAADPA